MRVFYEILFLFCFAALVSCDVTDPNVELGLPYGSVPGSVIDTNDASSQANSTPKNSEVVKSISSEPEKFERPVTSIPVTTAPKGGNTETASMDCFYGRKEIECTISSNHNDTFLDNADGDKDLKVFVYNVQGIALGGLYFDWIKEGETIKIFFEKNLNQLGRVVLPLTTKDGTSLELLSAFNTSQ
jgi:hypothetical protein